MRFDSDGGVAYRLFKTEEEYERVLPTLLWFSRSEKAIRKILDPADIERKMEGAGYPQPPDEFFWDDRTFR